MNNKRYTTLLMTAFLMAVLFGVTACSSEENIPGENLSQISFNVDSWTGTELTRAASGTTSAITTNGFGVSAAVYPTASSYTTVGCGSYFYNIHAYPNENIDYFWPTDNKKMAFYAYYPYSNSNPTVTSSETLGHPIYTYTVPQSVASQMDFMTSKVTDRMTSNTSSVSLSFKHRCSDIRFIVINNKAEDVTLNSISLYGVKYSGTYNGTSWSLNNTTNSKSQYTFTLAANSTATHGESTDITGTTNHFIILPQTISSGTEILNFVIDSEEHPFSPESNITFEEGKSYTFNVTIEDDEEIKISLTATIRDWVVETETDIIPGVNPADNHTIIGNWVFTPSDEDDSPTPQYPTDTNTIIGNWVFTPSDEDDSSTSQYPTTPNTGVNDWESEE